MLAIEPDYDRFVETHEPHYFHAQARGFALIRKVERHLKRANSYAGQYFGYTDHETPDHSGAGPGRRVGDAHP
jgi:hypothetical protein